MWKAHSYTLRVSALSSLYSKLHCRSLLLLSLNWFVHGLRQSGIAVQGTADDRKGNTVTSFKQENREFVRLDLLFSYQRVPLTIFLG
jgi:hypothetical protein